MIIKHPAVAGTLESSDVLVTVAPIDADTVIEIESVVFEQFGEALEDTVVDILQQFQIKNVRVTLNDRGALECTIRARLEAAFRRGGMEESSC